MDKTLIIYIISGGVALLLIVWLSLLERRLKRVFRGKQASDLEYVIATIGGKLEKIAEDHQMTRDQLNGVEKRLKTSIQKTSIIRFNPFKELGGDQSFVIALLDENNNGSVISSLHGRERTMFYAKPIEKGKSTHTLTKEEGEAIQQAINS